MSPETITEREIARPAEPTYRSGYTITEDPRVEYEVILCDWLPDAIRQLAAIIGLPAGWDSHGSPSPDAHAVEAGLGLLASLAKVGGLPNPHVSPTPSGGVQFEWENGDRYFELELVAERAAKYLYCDDAAGVEEEGEVFERESLDPVVRYIFSVAAVQ